ncbi:6-phosphogluconolactonase [Microlunatus soli]|uniref:Glucosamine-6-phosphate deaminase n=1 Tax=Microlunatus soli TaxID=630515 RepID=A0A1H1X6Q6_9ACTN|nr:6-phosphogluconolactonase [Microlunatus soli]SDT04279.1 glucosamine-6-phosphate deaminase [Microlunatus soli]
MSNRQPTVRVADSAAEAGTAAGLAAAEAIRAAISDSGHARVIFASAPSQQDMISTLADQQLDWSAVQAFHMDEYIGLAPDHPQSFGQWLADRLPAGLGSFDRILPGSDPESERRRYAAALQAPVDLVCMGIGVNGHIAFNEPGSDFDDLELVRQIELDQLSRQQQVDDGCFAALTDVPTAALTVTIPPLVAARTIVCTVVGPRKASAVAAALTGAVDPSCPASILQHRDRAGIYLDRSAAADLPV